MKNLFLLIMVLLLFGFASAESWIPTKGVSYDQFEDSSVDPGLWDILRQPVNESAGYMLLGGSSVNGQISQLIINASSFLDFRMFSRNSTFLFELESQPGTGDVPTQRIYISDNTQSNNISIGTYSNISIVTSVEFDYQNEQARLQQTTGPASWVDVSSLGQWRVFFEHINGASVGGNWGLRNYWTNYTVYGEVNITAPDSLTSLKNTLLYFNVTAIGSNNETLVNASLYLEGVLNQTNTLSGLSNSTFFTHNFTSSGDKVWSIEVCSQGGDCFDSGNSTLTVRSATLQSQFFDTPVLAGSNHDFSATINLAPATGISSASLFYNGTEYSPTVTVGASTATLNVSSVAAPSVLGTTNISFYWNVTTDDGQETRVGDSNQTVTTLMIDDCSTHTNVLYNFTMVEERNQNTINTASNSTEVSLDLQVFSSGTKTQIGNFSTDYTNQNPFAVCLSSPVTDPIDVDLQMQYDAVDFAPEFYHLQKSTVTSSNMNQNITLYSLSDSVAQEFKIVFKDASFLPVEDALIQIQRKYISEGRFKVVEIPKTDSDGSTLARLQLSDVVYTLVVVKNGAILASFENVLATCDNVATGDCQINLNAFSSYTPPDSFSSSGDFAFSFGFNKDTRLVTTVYSITSGAPSTVTLNVTLYDGFGTTAVCADSLSASGGTLSCTIPNSFGNATFIANLYEGTTLKGRTIVSLAQDPSEIYGGAQIFLALFIVLMLIGIGMTDHPMLFGVFLIISIVAVVAFNLVSSSAIVGAGATILFLIIAILLVMIRGRKS